MKQLGELARGGGHTYAAMGFDLFDGVQQAVERAAELEAEVETLRARCNELWHLPEMRDPRPEQSISDWISNIPCRAEWVVPGVLRRLVERIEAECAVATERQTEKFRAEVAVLTSTVKALQDLVQKAVADATEADGFRLSTETQKSIAETATST